MASADITISGHAAAGIYSNLDNTVAAAAVVGVITTAEVTALDAMASANTSGTDAAVDITAMTGFANARIAAQKLHDETVAAGLDSTTTAADLAFAIAEEAAASGTAPVAASNSGDGVYSNAGVDFTMTGATDNGISFSATVNIDAGTEIDAGDFELDGVIPGSAAEKPSQGEVLAVGTGKKLDNGSVQAVDLNVGDKVLFGQYAGSTVKVDGEELLVMSESEVFGVIE
jgi:chaperonin GroES